jgi:hypothetical protein
MIRRLALLVALLLPAAGLAQTAGTVVSTPTAFGPTDCTSTTATVSLSWTSSGAFVTGDTYSIYVSNSSSCPTTGIPTGTLVSGAGNLAATGVTQTYPTTGTLLRKTLITDAGISACTTNDTIYLCVQHWPSTGTSGTAKGTATGTIALEVEPPPVPVSVTVAPGDSALFVNWAAGTGSTVAAASYNVTAASTTPPETHTQNFTSLTGEHRVGGLTNGVTYTVNVTSVSAGGLESGPSLTVVTGTPAQVMDFWDQYHLAGREQGGCAGGPAGLVALLGVALALRGLRRRS